ncbi:helix-turn-helix domain-containing protein [Rhodohalobacter sulfatireducens]|uniref:Helix-turn-helix domain-containing protein n=1 Tax=Rhodohalobacter sulfatireducens TaxID=2911366 RepID=A0ABS9KJ27_9BACT|nr:helix-turn-helix domain-containing protein [Rhodohalobacter sulfatireducens]MCG2590859.1 helix-turn-helix domain-containing protein [Rhodohalobacter sulfatireducens]
MKQEIIQIASIHEIHQFLGLGKPKHPLISVFKFGQEQSHSINENFKYSLGLYQISIKGNCPYTISKYGRNSYDFQECSMVFTSPNQVLEVNNAYKIEDDDCWTLVFHPDLIRKSELGKQIDDFSFFNYASNEALHLSGEERKTITDISQKIIKEYSQNLDRHSQTLIISNLQLLLNYCVRFYDRQFYTRTNLNKDVVSEFEEVLKAYYKSDKQVESGIPSVQVCARKMNISPRYLSNLLRKETGKNTQEHIHHFIIEKAKTLLLGSSKRSSEIAYDLGFEYPQYFSKLFKKCTSMSPIEYRQNFN